MLASFQCCKSRLRNLPRTRFLAHIHKFSAIPQNAAVRTSTHAGPSKHVILQQSSTSRQGSIESEERPLAGSDQVVKNAVQAGLEPEKKISLAAQWLEKLEPLLPPHLRSSISSSTRPVLSDRDTATAITDIIVAARHSEKPIDLLSELSVGHGRWPALIWTVERLVAQASLPSTDQSCLPSNLSWPALSSFDKATFEPPEADPVVKSDTVTSQKVKIEPGREKASGANGDNAASLRQLWMSLGSIVVEATDLPSEGQRQAMEHVYRIIGRLHHFGLIPDQIYSYHHQVLESFVTRPPTLHLLSSRILTDVSDAVWRAQKDQWIAQAVESGKDHHEAVRNVPAGRIKVSGPDLRPEAWLEFILWCCVDSGFLEAGCYIVEKMRTKSDPSPWFATRHASSSNYREVDQDPYGRDPLAESIDHTISVEVCLALLEALIDTKVIQLGANSPDPENFQSSILNLLRFLEPHDVPREYFDYLIVRFLGPNLDHERDITVLRMLGDLVTEAMSLERRCGRSRALPSLTVTSILHQSEVYPGFLHQIFERCSAQGRLHPTMGVFNKIQQLSDRSKLLSIDAFLQGPGKTDHYSPAFPFKEEFTFSHGQLPPQRLGPFLETLTDAGLIDTAQWLLYSTDVDGPLIPFNLYSQLSLSTSILHLANATKDYGLMRDVASTVRQNRHRPSVGFIRRFADSQAISQDIRATGEVLATLISATGGGNDLGNISTIMAMIIRIENSLEPGSKDGLNQSLSSAVDLLEWILQGDFRASVGNFRMEDLHYYQSGLACLLRIAEAASHSSLSGLARSWIPKIGHTNVVSLDSRVFDIILSAVVETRGLRAGMMLWDLFGEDPDDIVPIPSSGGRKIAVVKPNFRTLRIIIRAALEDLEAAKSVHYVEDPTIPFDESDSSSKSNIRLLEEAIENAQLVQTWARPLFRRFGLSDDEATAEFQPQLGGGTELFSQVELKEKLRSATELYEFAKMGLLSQLSEVTVTAHFASTERRERRKRGKR